MEPKHKDSDDGVDTEDLNVRLYPKVSYADFEFIHIILLV
jgi:hypothetical protein